MSCPYLIEPRPNRGQQRQPRRRRPLTSSRNRCRPGYRAPGSAAPGCAVSCVAARTEALAMTITANDGRTVMSATEPSTPRLRLQPGAAPELLDGGWWPRSTDPVAELPGLILALDAVHGPITRVMLHGNDWDSHPRRLAVDGRLVRLGYFASQPAGHPTGHRIRDGRHRDDPRRHPWQSDPRPGHGRKRSSSGESSRLTPTHASERSRGGIGPWTLAGSGPGTWADRRLAWSA
jgi:hypothetical protein